MSNLKNMKICWALFTQLVFLKYISIPALEAVWIWPCLQSRLVLHAVAAAPSSARRLKKAQWMETRDRGSGWSAVRPLSQPTQARPLLLQMSSWSDRYQRLESDASKVTKTKRTKRSCWHSIVVISFSSSWIPPPTNTTQTHKPFLEGFMEFYE